MPQCGAFSLNGFELHAIDHGIKGIQDTCFILFWELGDIIEPFEHGRVFEQFPVLSLSEQVTHGCVQHTGQFFYHVNRGWTNRD